MGRVIRIVALPLVMIVAACATMVIAPQYPTQIQTHRPNVRVAVVGDVQRTGIVEVWRERNDVQRVALMRQIRSERPDVLVTLGDHVFWGASDSDWEYFDRLMKPIRDAKIPVFPILGNHEYFGSDADMLEHVKQRFPTFDSTYYYKVIDSVAYVFLNTNYRDIGMVAMSAQRRWYLRTMIRLDNDPGVQFIVVCGHHPPFTNSTVVFDDDILQSYFVPAFTHSTKGAIWFSGHCHAYEHFYKDTKHFVVSGGGGGPRQHLLTGPLSQHDDMYDGQVLRPFHYCTVERAGNILKFEMHPLHTEPDTPGDVFAVQRREVWRDS
jgi:hypothetical protein